MKVLSILSPRTRNATLHYFTRDSKKGSWYSLIVECQHVPACTVSLLGQTWFPERSEVGWLVWLEKELIKL